MSLESWDPQELVERCGWHPGDNIDVTETIGKNEFEVRHFKGIPGFWSKADEGKFCVYADEPGVDEFWSVALPHQCDAWEIGDHADFEGAVADLESFIVEAQQTLRKLRELGP